MRIKPRVCLIDDDPQVKLGWETALSSEAELFYYADPQFLFEEAKQDAELIASFDCVIIGRYLQQNSFDVFESNIPESLRNQGAGAVFLNWQGYLTKEEINAKFEGRLFNRYGVRWQTLRTRVQKIKTKKSSPKKITAIKIEAPERQTGESLSQKTQAFYFSKPQRCQELLKQMARQAAGRHKEKLEYYANHDNSTGIQLLEAIYNRLLTVKERSQSCPSRYINSSPVVAKNILQKALYG